MKGLQENRQKEEVKNQNSSSYNRNVGTIRLEGTSRGLQFNLLLQARVNTKLRPDCCSWDYLDRNKTASPGSMFQWLFIFIVKNYFCISSWNLSHFDLWSLPLIFPPCITVKGLSLSFWWQPCRSQSCLLSRLNKPRSLSLSSQGTWSSLLGALYWTYCSFLVSFLQLGDPKLDPVSKMQSCKCWIKQNNHFPSGSSLI